tara:strand:+ start:140 stop:688 length:549 start_codon:yes stop_codon:yes gene_type:complete
LENIQPYYRIPYLPAINETLKRNLAAATEDDWVDVYSFRTLPLDVESLVKEDPLLGWLNAAHPFSAGILSMDPWSYYDWHTDEKRGASINMMLTCGGEPGHYHSIFSHDRDDTSLTGNFVELRYQPEVYYLFNNQVSHSVYNFEKERLVFSTEFREEKDRLDFNSLGPEIIYALGGEKPSWR